jgi:hypothetical protein
MLNYRRNHYVPEWYQYRFLPQNLREQKFYYLDLKPEVIISNGISHRRNDLLRWGPSKCFYEKDLYTTKFGRWESTEIEENFFGKVDSAGRAAVDYFTKFKHPSANKEALHNMLLYLSIQKLRTPKGLGYLSSRTRLSDKNLVLFKMQELRQVFCALWTECIWSIVDAAAADTKFIISDHPVTVYNYDCFPLSKSCLGFNDPEIWFSGTHTLFPLSLDKLLILTNLSWVRYPYGNPLKPRPNPKLFRGAVFNFMQIQTDRMLTETEVNEINFIVKKRAYRYIAAANKEWLYPEEKIPTQYWNKLGNGYLLMPDPRSVTFSKEIIFGGDNWSDGFDAYGRKPWHPDYMDSSHNDREWETFHAFQGEFARVFGPKRRGIAYEHGQTDKTEDSPEFHAYHLRSEQQYKKYRYKDKRKK